MNAREYFDDLQRKIAQCPLVVAFDLSFREIDEFECYVKGNIVFTDNSKLEIVEYVTLEISPRSLKYKYQYMKENGEQVARWDNAPHHPELTNFPYHKHDATNKAFPSEQMDIDKVLLEVSLLIEY